MKQTISTCQPSGPIDYLRNPDDAKSAEWYQQAVDDGAQTEGLPHGTLIWCNAHTAILGTPPCRKAEVVLDDEHPMYGTPATLAYPQDRYPLVVTGGSKSGHTLVVSHIDEGRFDTRAGEHNGYPVHDRQFTSEELLSAVIPQRSFRIRKKKDGTYSQYVTVGAARYRRDWSD